jgi:hypothetical protein
MYLVQRHLRSTQSIAAQFQHFPEKTLDAKVSSTPYLSLSHPHRDRSIAALFPLLRWAAEWVPKSQSHPVRLHQSCNGISRSCSHPRRHQMQRRRVVLILCSDICATFNQEPHSFSTPIERRQMQRCRVGLIARGHVRPVCYASLSVCPTWTRMMWMQP